MRDKFAGTLCLLALVAAEAKADDKQIAALTDPSVRELVTSLGLGQSVLRPKQVMPFEEEEELDEGVSQQRSASDIDIASLSPLRVAPDTTDVLPELEDVPLVRLKSATPKTVAALVPTESLPKSPQMAPAAQERKASPSAKVSDEPKIRPGRKPSAPALASLPRALPPVVRQAARPAVNTSTNRAPALTHDNPAAIAATRMMTRF